MGQVIERAVELLIDFGVLEFAEKNAKLINATVFTLVLIILIQLGIITGIIDELVLDKIYQLNIGYLNMNFQKTTQSFIVISGFKGVVSVIEGSSLMGVELGDVIEPLEDLIDLTWKITIVSLVSLNIQQIILNFIHSTKAGLFNYLLNLGIILIFFSWFINELKEENKLLESCTKLGKLILIISLFIWVMLPLLICSSGAASEWIISGKLDNAIGQIDKEINQVERELKQIRNRVGEIKGIDIISGDVKKDIKVSFNNLFTFSPILLKNSMKQLCCVISCFILEAILFPAAVLIIEYYLLKAILI